MKADKPFICAGDDAEIIEFQAFSARRGLIKSCAHNRLIVDERSRAVWCSRCERYLDGMTAFLALMKAHESLLSWQRRQREEIEKERGKQAHMRALRRAESILRGGKMAVSCPHCRRGILAEDLERAEAVSAEFEQAMRRRGKERQQVE